MKIRMGIAFVAVVLVACVSETKTALDLTIIQPPYYKDHIDTIATDTIIVEGVTTVGAMAMIGATENPTIPVAVDNSGHFIGQFVVEDMEGNYSAFVKVSMANHDPILESRSVYYKPLH
ncbi:MAG TPA: hypothetical protein VLX68_15775 [Chitinivibrionales bacterium]|nr:hypothetical protein [Chitinivibrionales bacterium]